jgi:hypothetical protein
MSKKKKSVKPAPAKSSRAARGTALPRPSAEAIEVAHLDQAVKFVKPKRIHPRRILPLIREGAEREFHSATPRAMLEMFRPGVLAAAPAGGLALATNTALTSPGAQQTASNVDEPSVAVNGQVVLYTGNWYAAISTDAGQTFKFINPATAFKQFDPPNSSFCCDQVATYIPQIDTFIWLLQYGPDTGDNIQRLAFAKTADASQGKWRLFDITTAFLQLPGVFLDFPDLAVGANALYVTTNWFQGQQTAGAAVVRIPLASIDAGQVVAKPFVSSDFQSFRVAQNCDGTAFFAAHQDTSTLAVFSWPEADDAPTSTAVGVARWIGGNGYTSRTPDGQRWLDRADPRITGATKAGNELWFAWAVDTGSNRRPRPFVQIARIDAGNLTLLENINIFDPDSAICYGALATNANQEVGISYMIGGGPRFPSHVVGILTGTRRDMVVTEGARAPLPAPDSQKFEWGDFLAVRPAFPNNKLFAATGYTMQGPGDGSNRDATPRFVVFGRAEDVAGPGLAPTARGTTTHLVARDVHRMPVADLVTASQLKAAAGLTSLPTPLFAEAAPKPGLERWAVKTGTDQDVDQVGQQIVPTTVEEMVELPRPAALGPTTSNPPAFQERRVAPVETTIWQLDADITVLKQESDGDYHLVLLGASGQTMIGEIPTPRPPFVQLQSPFLDNIKEARQAVDDKLVRHLAPADFVAFGGTFVPRQSLMAPADAPPANVASFVTPAQGVGPAFRTAIQPTRARITGVGFFDTVHGQTGVSQANGIELHPILKIEWL